MVEQGATLSVVSQPLADLQAMALGLRPESSGQTIAQQEIVTSLEQALDARRQRIIVSQSSANGASREVPVVLPRCPARPRSRRAGSHVVRTLDSIR
jgi:hypothetical protein